MKTFLAIFLILPLMMAAMAIPNANASIASITRNLYADGPDTAWGLDVGDVTISNNATHIIIVYTVAAVGNITEVHCAVAGEAGGIPQKGNGNPKVGKFACNVDFDPGSEPTTYTCALPYPAGKVAGDIIVVACQASVQIDESALPTTNPVLLKYTVNGEGIIAIPETAWAADEVTDGLGGHQFNTGRNWATYIHYTIEAVKSSLTE